MVAQSDHPANPFEAISAKFNRSDASPESESGSSQDKTARSSAPPLVLPEDILSPAIILSKKMRIIWQNPLAASRLWHQKGEKTPDLHLLDIFDIVLSSDFQNSVRNWRQWAAFFIRQALTMMPKEALEQLIAQKEDRQTEILQAMLTDFEPSAGPLSFSGNLQQLMHQDCATNYQVLGLSFNQGRLLVFEPLDIGPENDLTHTRSACFAPPAILMRTYKHPIKISFYVLSARLNGAETFASEMLAKDYGRLLNRLWGLTKEIVEQYNGLFNQYDSGVATGYFITTENEQQQPLKVIQCALALKNQMNDLGREWKIQMSWLHDIELNIGIHGGTEYVTSLPSSLGDNLLPLGKTRPLANRLSTLSRPGQIWITKTVIDQIPDDEVECLKFGIFRDDQPRRIFIPNCFTRIRDISGVDPAKHPEEDPFSLDPVTMVFDYQAQ